MLANKLEMISKFFLHNNYMELNNSLLKKHWTETLERRHLRVLKGRQTVADRSRSWEKIVCERNGFFVSVGNLTGNT